jgi:membrane protein implicated in regulation of membrane protease activity
MSGWDWNAIYLTCFAVGLVMSFVTFLGGALHLHIGKFHGHGLAKGARGVGPRVGHGASPLNGFTLMAFLCWFGGTGYLMHDAHIFSFGLVLLFAAVSGVAGASLVFWFLVKVLMPGERTLEAEDTEIVGMVGRLSTALPGRGYGEVLYSQNGARRCATVKSEDGSTMERGTEVVVMRYERGVAYVRRWEEFEDGLLKDKAVSSE